MTDDALKPMTRANKLLFVNELHTLLQNGVDQNEPYFAIKMDQETAILLIAKLESAENVK